MILDFGLHQKRYGRDAKGIFLRKELKQLEAAIAEAKRVYIPLGAKWQEQKGQFVFRSGAVLKFRQLERDADAEKYQGHDYTRVYCEELTNWATPTGIDKMKATLRSAAGVPCRFRATANPGGPGHSWVKDRYIDAGPFNVVTETFKDPYTGVSVDSDRVFIPARLDDNPALLENDPQYVARLYQSGSKELVRAWLAGDWDIIEGAFFDCWDSAKHVVEPFPIPAEWTKFRSCDWGSAAPFSVGWWAVAMERTVAMNSHGDRVVIPRGSLIRYREWYGKSAPNVGLKLTAEEVARGIKSREQKDEDVDYGVADPSMFAQDGGPSIAERMAGEGVFWRRADNKRVAKVGSIGGWDQMRARFIGANGHPRLFVFAHCKDFIRTVPALPHDPNRLEDVDTDAEDHAADEARYACMSRPYQPAPKEQRPERFDDYAAQRTEQKTWRMI